MSLLVCGALHWDVVVRAPRLPRLDETLRGSDVACRFGGKGGNQAIAAALAGAEVAFAGRIGGDEAGAAMRDHLLAAGIDVAQLQTGTGASGISTAIVTEDGSYGAVIVSGENLGFDADALRMPKSCRMLLLQNEMAPGVLPVLAAKAGEAGAHVVLNAAPARDLLPADLNLADTLIVNRVEAADLLEVAEGSLGVAEMIAGLQRQVPEARILLTLGGDGVASAEPAGALHHQPARQVTVHSTHGAGDVFVGAFAAAQVSGADLPRAVQAGQDAAADHVSQTR